MSWWRSKQAPVAEAELQSLVSSSGVEDRPASGHVAKALVGKTNIAYHIDVFYKRPMVHRRIAGLQSRLSVPRWHWDTVQPKVLI